MARVKTRAAGRANVRLRIRSRVSGTPERPRLAVFKSLKHFYAQVIDDTKGATLVSASSLDAEFREKLSGGGNRAAAEIVGEIVARRAQKQGVRKVVFDRGGHPYHGNVKALAEAARANGLEF